MIVNMMGAWKSVVKAKAVQTADTADTAVVPETLRNGSGP